MTTDLRDEGERWSLDELRVRQLERLKDTVHRVYANVPHYKKSWDEAGVHPDDIRELSDLAKLPFTDKLTLRDNYPFGLFAVPREQVVRIHASSGTTGKPTVVGYTREDIEMWAGVMARSIRAAGGRPGDVLHVAYGYGLFTGGLGAHYGAEKLGCTVVPISGGMTERQVQLIQDFGCKIMMVTPSYFLSVLDEFERQGIDPASTTLKIGIFGAEPWTPAMRTEIVDPLTGEVLPDGEQGELVFTSLTKQAFPVIRYRTKDLTRLLPGTAFPTMRRMEKVTGRTDDMMIIRGVNVFPTQIEEIILAEPGLAPYFQCVLSQPGNMLELTVLAESTKTLGDADRVELEKRIGKRIKDNIGTTAKIEVRAPGGIERSVGKARRIVDTRKSPFPT